VKFQGTVEFRDVYKVDLGFPCYRLANGRTQAAQSEIISTEGLSSNFFTADPDSAEALKRQDEILRKMILTGTDKQIVEILQRDEQTEPLFLDSSGYVINGNRRLRAMRMLVGQNETEYTRFKHVQVLFLPPCTQEDIDELEAKLQWLPHGRSEYSWVNKAIVLRQRQQRGWTVEKLSKFFEMIKKDVQLWIAMLEDAEAYLDERNQAGQYSRVVDHQYAFQELQRGRRKCGMDEAKKQFFTYVSYMMIDDAGETGGRLYDNIPDALKFLDDIADQCHVDLEIESTTTDGNASDGLDLLGDSEGSRYEPLIPVVRNESRKSKVRAIVRDKIEQRKREEHEQQGTTYCLREARKALTALQNVRSNLDKDSDVDGLESILNNIDAASSQIRMILSQR